MGGAGGQGGAGGAMLCVPGETASCYTGPPGSAGTGACKEGTSTCLADGSGFGACEGAVVPGAETCNTPEDDDCDGLVNEEGAGCACVPGSLEACYTGPSGTEGMGVCAGGQKTCNALGTGYDACAGEVLPSPELCGTEVDDDCDGQVNEAGADCLCAPGSVAPCYTGPEGSSGVGICASGTQICNTLGTGYGPCADEVLPALETCTTQVDDDCDGQVNESGDGCVCVPGTTEACYSGPTGTAGAGICKQGTRFCNEYGTDWSSCEGEVLPKIETCTTPVDDDCDGTVNESGDGCICMPYEQATCYTGPAGTNGVGICRDGFTNCNDFGTGYVECVGEQAPLAEQCDVPGFVPLDEDCDGQMNEGCPLLDVSGGYYHSVALRANGDVYAWGYNTYGQVGDNTTVNKSVPTKVLNLSNIKAIEAGYYHTLAIRNDGTLWAWGRNASGQIGDNTTTQRPTAVQVTSLGTNVVAIAAGESHSLAITANGKLWAWGSNSSGQLGNGTTTSSSVPVEVSTLTNVIAVTAGASFTLALTGDGRLWGFGTNTYGQLGNGGTPTTSVLTPLQTTVIPGVVRIAAGYGHALGMRLDGSVFAWGYNVYGQLGNGTTTNSAQPVIVQGLTNAVQISASYYNSSAVLADGTVWTWGYNAYGQLGNGTTTASSYAQPVPGITNGFRVSSGHYYHTMLLLQTGGVSTFGYNFYGQIGNNTTSPTTVSTPFAVPFP
jgi:alpha-tubulin suppressor-like RCC1 family protein